MERGRGLRIAERRRPQDGRIKTQRGDSEVELNETVIVTLSNAVNATLGSTVTHTYVILDDDAAPLPPGALINDDFQTDVGNWSDSTYVRTETGRAWGIRR